LAYGHPVFVDRHGKRHPCAFENYVGQIDVHKWNASYVETSHNEVNVALGLLNTIPNVSGVVFRSLDRSFPLFHDANWKKMKVCGDWLFYLYLSRGGRIAYCADAHSYYRIHKASTSKRTHDQAIYYQEHQQVACAIATLYRIPEDLLVRFHRRLKDFYFKNVASGTAEEFDRLFDLNEAIHRMQVRCPNVLMATYGFTFGGGEIFPIRLANALAQAGASITFFNGGYEPTIPGVRELLSPRMAVINNTPFLDLDEIVVDFGIEIIHTHHASMESRFAARRARGSVAARHVATMHGMYEMMSAHMFLDWTRDIRKSVDHWVYTADKNIVPFKKHGLYNPAMFTRIDNGMQLPTAERVDLGPLGIASESFVACLASRALPTKGWREAIEATTRVRELTKRDVHLLLIGEGEVHDALREKPPPWFVHLLGNRADLADFLASSHLGLLPSYFEGESFPLVLIEYFMAGLPVIASNIGEISKMMKVNDHRSAGSLIELRNGRIDPNELADAMIRMLTDRQLYDDCVSAVGLLKSRFNIENTAQHYLAVYKRALG
jgi:glycosyltransferase involved in cell wall biosynthesis